LVRLYKEVIQLFRCLFFSNNWCSKETESCTKP
jgi:hypothetical protein